MRRFWELHVGRLALTALEEFGSWAPAAGLGRTEPDGRSAGIDLLDDEDGDAASCNSNEASYAEWMQSAEREVM